MKLRSIIEDGPGIPEKEVNRWWRALMLSVAAEFPGHKFKERKTDSRGRAWPRNFWATPEKQIPVVTVELHTDLGPMGFPHFDIGLVYPHKYLIDNKIFPGRVMLNIIKRLGSEWDYTDHERNENSNTQIFTVWPKEWKERD